MNCEHNFGVHIVVKDNAEQGQAQVQKLKEKYLKSEESTVTTCPTPFIIFEQEKEEVERTPDGKKVKKNRIDRISKLRDFQRATLKKIFEEGGHMNNGVIMPVIAAGTAGYNDSEAAAAVRVVQKRTLLPRSPR